MAGFSIRWAKQARGTPAHGFDDKDLNYDDKHEYFGDECDDKHT